MFWQFGSRSEVAVAAAVGAPPVAAGVPAADVGFVVAWLPPHAVATAATNARATVIRRCPMPPGERFIDTSSLRSLLLPSSRDVIELGHANGSPELGGPICREDQL